MTIFLIICIAFSLGHLFGIRLTNNYLNYSLKGKISVNKLKNTIKYVFDLYVFIIFIGYLTIIFFFSSIIFIYIIV